MKKFIVVLLAAFFAVSCSLSVSDKTGSLTLSGARGVLNDLNGNPATVRYSLTRNGKSIPLNNQALLDVIGSDIATIDSLIPGDGYKLGVSVGYKAGNNFVVDSYGYSDTFSIAEGTNSPVNVALQNAPQFTWLTSTGGKSSAAVDATVSLVYILDQNKIGSFDSTAAPAVPSVWTTPVVPEINSLTTGKLYTGEDDLWLNTTAGIYRYNAGVPLFNLNPGLTPNVTYSRAVGVGLSKVVAFYSGGGTTLGMVFADALLDFTSAWQTIADYPAIADFIPEIKQDVIRSIGINVSNSFFYVATPLGTAIGSATINNISDLLDTGGTHWLQIPGGTTPIQVVSTAGNRVYAASNYGLYTDIVDTNISLGVPTTGLTLILGTEGKRLIALESIEIPGNSVLTAAVTSDNSVFIIKNNMLIETLPAAVGNPFQSKPMFYDNSNSSSIHLILSGTNGSIDYDTTIGSFSGQ